MPLPLAKEDPHVQGERGTVLRMKGARPSSSSEDPVTEKPDAKRPRWFISPVRGGPHQNPNPDPVPVHQATLFDVEKRPPIGPRTWFVSSELLKAAHQNRDPVHQAKPSEEPDVCGDPFQEATPSDGVQSSEPLTLPEIMKKLPRRRESEEEQLQEAQRYAEWKDPAVIDFHNRVGAFIRDRVWRPKLKDQTFTPESLAAAEARMKKHRDKPFRNHDDFLKRRRAESQNEKDACNKYVEGQKSIWTCMICLKTGDHMSLECPYLDYVPEGASVGPGVEIDCKGCTFKGKHDNTHCVKRAKQHKMNP